MRPSNWGKFDPTQLADNFASWKQNLAVPLQKVVRDIEGMLTNGLLQRDNAYAALISLDCKHGVPKEFANPFGANKRPIGFHMLTCENAVGQPLEFSGSPVAVAGPPALTRNSADGLLYLTVQYAPPLWSPQHAMFRRSTAQTIPDSSNIVIVYDTTDDRVGTGINHTAGVTTIDEAGLYTVGIHYSYTSAAPQIRTELVTSGGYDVADLGYGSAAATIPHVNYTWVVRIKSAKETLSVSTFHNTGAPNDINFFAGDARFQSRLVVTRIPPGTDPATTARVTGILVGG
jgi:hypothetical protein